MVQFVKVSELLEEPVTLRVCSSEASPIMCLRWQPYGTLSYLPEAGVTLDDSEFIEKASAVVELAIEGNYDLLLVPEYSFPHSVLGEIVGDKSKWPKAGALWCLSAQGRELRAFLDELSEWKQSDVIVPEAKIGLERNYVCPLVYLFVDATGERLNAIVQYKLHPSSDQWLLHEGAHLSTGSNVFLFDLSGPNTDCVNYFFSLICADILALEPVSTIVVHSLSATYARIWGWS
jgi:hypothetical protein